MSSRCDAPGCRRRKWSNDKFCIFHSTNIEGKKATFEKKFWEEFDRQKNEKEVTGYDFSFFVFPDNISFENRIFDKNVSFIHAEFNGSATFDGATFLKSADFTDGRFFGNASFVGTQFSEKADFERAEFSRASNLVDFGYAEFKGLAFFRDVKFHKGVSFEKSLFSGEASFVGTQFKKFSTFGESKFSGKTEFKRAEFSGTSKFDEAQFLSEVNFKQAQFSKDSSASFFNSRFLGKVDFSNVHFQGTINFDETQFLEYVNFLHLKTGKYNDFRMDETYVFDVVGLFEFITQNNKKFKKTKKTEFLPDNFKLILGEKAMARYPLIGRKIKDDIYLLSFKEKHPNIHWWWWLLSNCGRSFWQWAAWSLGLAVLFGIIYSPCPEWFPESLKIFCERSGPQFIFTPTDLLGQTPELLSLLYFSFVTFTTLGFGDIAAANLTARILVTIEVILGYIMLGGLISIMATKLARRS